MARIRSLKLRWVQGHLAELTWEHSQRLLLYPRASRWRPAINAYRCDKAYCICVDLAGVAKEEIEILIEPGALRISGSRTGPDPHPSHGKAIRVLALEIDSGDFERTVQLPAEVVVDGISAEQENGLLWIKIPTR